MAHSLNNNLSVKLRLEVTSVYTFTGVKHLYKLPDMAYGEWLIFKDDKPYFYFNIFDEDYIAIKDKAGDNVERYLEDRLRMVEGGLTLKQRIFGLRGVQVSDEWITIEKLPKNLLD
jgi:hypothetical protein